MQVLTEYSDCACRCRFLGTRSLHALRLTQIVGVASIPNLDRMRMIRSICEIPRGSRSRALWFRQSIDSSHCQFRDIQESKWNRRLMHKQRRKTRFVLLTISVLILRTSEGTGDNTESFERFQTKPKILFVIMITSQRDQPPMESDW